jgi:hypothetical protein
MLFAFSTVQVFGEGNWQANKHQWESLVPDKDHVRKIQGGDINGDLKDDIVLFYSNQSSHVILALVSKGDRYALVSFDTLSSDVITRDWIARVDKVTVEDNTIIATLDFKIANLISDLSGSKETTLKFKYLEDKIKLTELFSTGDLFNGQIAQVYYNVQEGQVYLTNLSKEERVGEPNGYYYRSYSRVIAPRVKHPLKTDCDGNKWVMLARPQLLKNDVVNNRITYGFERWRSDRDLSGKYYMAYDAKNIYLYVQVNDDVVRQSYSGDKSLRGDHIELWFADVDNNRYQIGLNPGDFNKIQPEALLWFDRDKAVSNRKLTGVAVQSRRTDEGYVIESRIPIQTFGVECIADLVKFTMVLSDSDWSDRQEKIMTSSSLVWSDPYSLGEVLWN